MSKEETNIITMKIKYHTETKEDSDRIFQMMVNYNNIVKCTYNYLLKHPKASTSEISHYQNTLNNIFLDTHFKGSAIYEAKALIKRNGKNKVIFGGKKLFIQRCQNKTSKEDFYKQKTDSDLSYWTNKSKRQYKIFNNYRRTYFIQTN